jgi:hypothetical protein
MHEFIDDEVKEHDELLNHLHAEEDLYGGYGDVFIKSHRLDRIRSLFSDDAGIIRFDEVTKTSKLLGHSLDEDAYGNCVWKLSESRDTLLEVARIALRNRLQECGELDKYGALVVHVEQTAHRTIKHRKGIQTVVAQASSSEDFINKLGALDEPA